MNLRGIIFDLDGTLADTIPLCVAAFQHTLNIHGGPSLSYSEVETYFGPSEEGMLMRALPEYSLAVLETYLAEYQRLHTTLTNPFSGIKSLLEVLKERDRKLAIVTGKGPRSAEISSRSLGLHSFFTHIEAGSPHGIVKSEAILRIVGDWGLNFTEVAYVGDSPIDIEAARSVGVISVGAAWAPGVDCVALKVAKPTVIFVAVEDFSSWATAGSSGAP